MSLILCTAAFLGCFVAGRRSLLAGLVATVTVGYFFGITRANIPDTFSYFIFDLAVLGLYAAQLFRPLQREERQRIRPILSWIVVLSAWPVFLLLFPVQDALVQLVGLRSHIFLLPFLLLGARLGREDLYRFGMAVAALNLVAFGFAVAEFLLGVQRFYPRNAVTELIYRSGDAAGTGVAMLGLKFLRIPATFANSAAYAGTMVITLALLLGMWAQRGGGKWRSALVTASLVATGLGVFLAASRTHFLVLVVLVMVATLSGALGATAQISWIGILAAAAWIVSSDLRLQRFMSIDPGSIVDRLSVSVNDSFVSLALRYPMGNGLGGGGTSMPYFLENLIRNRIGIENEYARIMLEQGIPGLFLWLCFLLWVFTRGTNRRADPWFLARRLTWVAGGAYFASGMIGVGLLTSVPFTPILLLCLGWMVTSHPVEPAAPPLSGGRDQGGLRKAVPSPVAA